MHDKDTLFQIFELYTVNVIITTGSYLRRLAFLVQSAGTKFREIPIPNT